MPDRRRPQYLSARDAAALLGVSRASLYSYVSRGRLRADVDPRNPRVSRYLTADVERLRERKEARLRPDDAARKTLDWGMPVLASALTLIDRGRLYYRGHDVRHLVQRGTFEDVVRLLWDDPRAAPVAPRISRRCGALLSQADDLSPIARMQIVLPCAAADDADAASERPEHVVACGWRILSTLVAAATLCNETHGTIAERLVRGWRVRDAAARRLIDMALILCADHELNVSAFTARVVASARSTPYDVVTAALAALRGALHGGHTTRVEALLDEAGSPRALRRAVAAYVARDEFVPGFGHPLYPNGDPRAQLLMTAVERLRPRSDVAGYVRAAKALSRGVVGEAPTIDFALVMLRRALDLPRDGALALFALGRTAGWLAHAMEQYAGGHLIRPRAAYVGSAPRRERSDR